MLNAFAAARAKGLSPDATVAARLTQAMRFPDRENKTVSDATDAIQAILAEVAARPDFVPGSLDGLLDRHLRRQLAEMLVGPRIVRDEAKERAIEFLLDRLEELGICGPAFRRAAGELVRTFFS